MAYIVQIAQEVYDYLNACERLTPADRARITDGMSDELGRMADEFLARNPHPYLPNRFGYDYTQITEAREVRTFVFAAAPTGTSTASRKCCTPRNGPPKRTEVER